MRVWREESCRARSMNFEVYSLIKSHNLMVFFDIFHSNHTLSPREKYITFFFWFVFSLSGPPTCFLCCFVDKRRTIRWSRKRKLVQIDLIVRLVAHFGRWFFFSSFTVSIYDISKKLRPQQQQQQRKIELFSRIMVWYLR